jgi:hypothetical protein
LPRLLTYYGQTAVANLMQRVRFRNGKVDPMNGNDLMAYALSLMVGFLGAPIAEVCTRAVRSSSPLRGSIRSDPSPEPVREVSLGPWT